MQLEYKFEIDDAVAFNRHFMFKSNYGRRTLRRALVCIVLLSFLGMYFMRREEPLMEWIALAALCAAGAGCLHLLALPLLIKRTIIAVHAGPASAQPFGERRLVLEPAGAREFSARTETFATFDSMAEPIETATHVFIQINPLQAFVIPKTKIDAGSLHEFLSMLKSAKQVPSQPAPTPPA